MPKYLLSFMLNLPNDDTAHTITRDIVKAVRLRRAMPQHIHVVCGERTVELFAAGVSVQEAPAIPREQAEAEPVPEPEETANQTSQGLKETILTEINKG